MMETRRSADAKLGQERGFAPSQDGRHATMANGAEGEPGVFSRWLPPLHLEAGLPLVKMGALLLLAERLPGVDGNPGPACSSRCIVGDGEGGAGGME